MNPYDFSDLDQSLDEIFQIAKHFSAVLLLDEAVCLWSTVRSVPHSYHDHGLGFHRCGGITEGFVLSPSCNCLVISHAVKTRFSHPPSLCILHRSIEPLQYTDTLPPHKHDAVGSHLIHWTSSIEFFISTHCLLSQWGFHFILIFSYSHILIILSSHAASAQYQGHVIRI